MTAALLALNSRTFSSLRKHRNYRLYFIGQIVSVSGTWMQDTALPWLILGLTHSPVYVGLLVFARYAPFMLFGLFSGVLADRFDNRRIVIVTQSGSMLVAAGLAVLAFSGVGALWPYFVLAFLGGAALVFDAPNRHALTFQLVGREELPNAVALNSSPLQRRPGRRAGDRRRADRGGRHRLVLRDQRRARSWRCSPALLMMRPSELYKLEARSEGKAGAAIREGLRVRTADARGAGSSSRSRPSSATTGFNFRVLLPVLASKTLHSSAAVFGVLFASLRRRRAARCARRGRDVACFMARLVLGAAGFSSAMLLLAPVHNWVLAAALLLVVGFCFSTWTANSQSILQLTAPDRLRGRVLSLYLFVFAGFSPIGGLLAGWLADVGGTELAFAVAGVSGLAATFCAAARLRA